MTTSSSPWEITPTLNTQNFQQGYLEVLDQTRLPFETRYCRIESVDDGVVAIRDMWVRGAPLIGVVAAWTLALSMAADSSDGNLSQVCTKLLASRPTAVNLRWAIQRMQARLLPLPPASRGESALAEASQIEQDEIACCERIGEHGAQWISEQVSAAGRLNVLTHCNAGWLATGAWGTALAPVYRLARQGVPVHLWVDETRPRNQGSRLTAWELQQAGIAHTVVADNAAGHLMRAGKVDVVIVGSDRTTAGGDVCNKIGTYQKALAAHDNGIPLLAALPFSTIDWTIEDGMRDIEIECRSPEEVLWAEGPDRHGELHRITLASPGSPALNYAFDVTPARLVTTLVTEHGCVRADASEMSALHQRVAV